jgi:hypothetical protein
MYPDRGLQPVYSCQAGPAYFMSLDSGCEGQSSIELDGYSSIANPGGYVQIFRCRATSGNDHWVSWDSKCEGFQPEGSLGYISTAVSLTRYYGLGSHWSLSGAAPTNFHQEQTFATLSATTGTPIYSCALGNLGFTSLDKQCEGQLTMGTLGFISPTPKSGLVPLYRCYLPSAYDHFDTTASNCEGAPGAVLDYVLGYVSPS